MGYVDERYHQDRTGGFALAAVGLLFSAHGSSGAPRSGAPGEGACADGSGEADVAEYAEANGLDEGDSIYAVCREGGPTVSAVTSEGETLPEGSVIRAIGSDSIPKFQCCPENDKRNCEWPGGREAGVF